MSSADVTAFRLRSDMPKEDIDLLESSQAGYLDATIVDARADIYARLRKRYDVTFPHGEPAVVWRWLTKIVTPDAFRKRGCNPSDPTIALFETDRARAYDQIKEAADAVDGLYDLPLLANAAGSGISKGGPIGYSEPDAYTWMDVQRDAVRDGR